MAGKALLLVMAEVEPQLEREFNDWHDGEQVPAMLRVPGVLSARRYRALQGKPGHMAMYELEDLGVLDRAEYRRLRPWGAGAEAAVLPERLRGSVRVVVRAIYQHLLTLPDPEPEELGPARALMLRGLEIPPEHDEEFQDWYNTEHLPGLSRVPGVVRSRRFKLHPAEGETLGSPSIYMAHYELEHREVQASDDWKRVVATPWSSRIRRLFIDRLRNIYQRVHPA